jgi:hypothetical protein
VELPAQQPQVIPVARIDGARIGPSFLEHVQVREDQVQVDELRDGVDLILVLHLVGQEWVELPEVELIAADQVVDRVDRVAASPTENSKLKTENLELR